MTAIVFSLYIVFISPVAGRTEILIAYDLTHIQCLLAGRLMVEEGRADDFACRMGDTEA